MLPRFVTRTIILIAGILLLGWVPAAGAAPITGGGIDAGEACPDVNTSCFADRDFDVIGVGTATGSITYSGGPIPYLFDLDVDVASLIMEDTGVVIDGVDKIVFSNLTFDVLDFQAFDFGNTGIASGPGPRIGTVTGTYEQFLGATSVVGATAFSQQVAFTALTCPLSLTGQCGFSVGFLDSAPNSSLHLNIGETGAGADYQFEWTFNVAVPEPSSATLLGLGLIGLVSARRRRV